MYIKSGASPLIFLPFNSITWIEEKGAYSGQNGILQMRILHLLNLFMLGSVVVALIGCSTEERRLFTRLSPQNSGVTFVNEVEETPEINILSYEYTYNGGGVAAGDFNNDGLCDLYFTGNQVSNRLYINRGNLTFQDITETSKTSGRKLWKTGVSAADINGDGWLDLYVCYSGPDSTNNLSNQLFINNGCDIGGEPTFTESAVDYKVDASGTFSTQASFFDYDRDGDLDMFLINHGNHFYSPFINTNLLRNMRHPQFGNRLYRNELFVSVGSDSKPGKYFTEVSQEAGIHGGGINFGLGVSVSDVNDDGWPDIFVTNDYEEQDFLYINNANGTFTDCTKRSFGHLSRNGMGTDLADFNNDGRSDLMEVDMWPEDNYRQKLLRGPDDYNRYNLMLDSGFHHQQMRNTLQLNAGIGKNGEPIFCEVGQLAGVSATDWSWAPLFVDVDNDGLKDLFVTNGYLRDFTSMDFLKYTVEQERKKATIEGRELNLYELIGKMPSTKTSDYLFLNNGDLTFKNYSSEAGIDTPNLSFGATYADLDNDGDQELIINNTNETATIWQNHSNDIHGNNFLQVVLQGPPGNPNGIGTKVSVVNTDGIKFQEQYLTRGFQSSVSPVIHFGLGKSFNTATLRVIWPDGKISLLKDVKSNQRITIDYGSALTAEKNTNEVSKLFSDITKKVNVHFEHRENIYHDFDHEPLLPYMLSREGPALAAGDVNSDGQDDFYVGGASGQASQLFVSDGTGSFRNINDAPWNADADREDTGATFFDADGDKDLDLFVVSGGNEKAVGSLLLDDRLYVNEGNGVFSQAPLGSIVADHANGSCVTAADFDRDGDLDLFVGGRGLSGSFPVTTPGAILRNETDRSTKKLKFVVATKEVNPDLRSPGMVTDATWADINGDTWPDLIVVGEWMPIRIFTNQQGRLFETNDKELVKNAGLWKSIGSVDIDKDGDLDFVVGNSGTNLPWRVTQTEPMTIYYSDINNDGRIDPVICRNIKGKNYPIASRDELLYQVNSLRKKFISYSSFGNATIDEILDSAQLRDAPRLKITNTQSSLLLNHGNGNFKIVPLPVEVQFSALQGMVSDDFDGDQNQDVLIAGNFFPYRTQFGPSDASLGLFLKGNGKGSLRPVSSSETGFLADGDVRGIALLKSKTQPLICIVRNNGVISIFQPSYGRSKIESQLP
jgi:enediyne biosynthesis protein E4